MPIGGKRIANSIAGGIKEQVAKALDDSNRQIATALAELVGDIQDGTKDVVRAIRSESDGVRQEFADIVGNAQRETDDAVEEVRKVAVEGVRPTNGSGTSTQENSTS